MTTEVIDLLVAENQRLQREVRELRERVRAYETSRWQQLHPRNLLRVRASTSTEVVSTSTRPAPAAPDRVEPSVLRLREEVLARGEFTRDWFTAHLGPWEPLLHDLEGRAARVLEIGSYEGLSTCYLLSRLPDATTTCIDTFAEAPRIDSFAGVQNLEATFDRNVALVDASRVRKLVGRSVEVLSDLVADGPSFDLVYVDGSHLGLDVIVDAALSWQVLKPGGALIFDDYEYRDHGEDPLLRPGPAIDAFLALVEGKYERLFSGYQLAIRKNKPAVTVSAP
jgi:hypothetical protein